VSIPLPVVLEGIIVGLNYGLLAIGLVLVYRTNRVLNFAQGQLGVVAAVFMVKLYYDFGINYWAALVTALILAAAAGAGSELLLRRLFNRPRIMVMVATIGLSQVLYLLTVLPFIRPKKLFEPFPVPISTSFTLDGFRFPPGEVVSLVAAPIVAIGIAAFVRWSPWGLAMRAMAENADSARLSGVWVRRTSTVAWTLAGALSGIAAILNSPGQTLALTQVLSPDLLLLALTAALVGAMASLPVTFVAAIGVGVISEVLQWNLTNPTTGIATTQLILFGILLAALLVRVGALKIGARGGETSTWRLGTSAFRPTYSDPTRRLVGKTGIGLCVVVAALLPLVVSTGQSFLISQMCVYAMIALSLTVLTGWGGQVSLGQFGLVAVGADIASHLGGSVPVIFLLPLAGLVTAVIAVLVGLPALRVRGLYLAVSTLGFAVFMQTSVLATPCVTLPFIHRTFCTGLPDPGSTLISRPTLFGLQIFSERAFAWFSLIVLVLSVLMVRVWRDKGIARRLIAVRDNEVGAGSGGTPVVRTKLLAFALSGFIAGYAGVMLAFATERFSTDTFDPTFSILVVSMVVIGGLDSITGAILGAIYLIGLPAIFGATPTIEFLTSGLGLLAFILYLPGGMAELVHRLGDLVTSGVEKIRDGPGPQPGGATPVGAEPVGTAPAGAAPVGATPVGAVPTGAAPVGATGLGATALGKAAPGEAVEILPSASP
jgi:ABC-type branched-subunit amino acid transport system permease subunit